MGNPAPADVKFLVNKCILLGLIDRTYQIETLYKKGAFEQATYVLDSLITC